MILFFKSSVQGYTRSDGTVVKPYEKGDRIHHPKSGLTGKVSQVNGHWYTANTPDGERRWHHKDVELDNDDPRRERSQRIEEDDRYD